MEKRPRMAHFKKQRPSNIKYFLALKIFENKVSVLCIEHLMGPLVQ